MPKKPKKPKPAPTEKGPERKVFINGKEIPADEVEIIYEGVFVPGEDRLGSLHIKTTHEGIIMDVWGKESETGENTNFGTSSEMAEEITERLCEENS